MHAILKPNGLLLTVYKNVLWSDLAKSGEPLSASKLPPSYAP